MLPYNQAKKEVMRTQTSMGTSGLLALPHSDAYHGDYIG
jgi:hypothetical protein